MDTNLNSAATGAAFPGGFSVLMAVYGRDDAALLESALVSIWANTLLPDQLVLVVDGPVPSTLDDVIHRVATRPVVDVIRLASNRGLASALNAGLEQVRCRWTVRADTDDINLPGRFALMAAAVQQDSQVDVLGGAILEVERDGRPVAVRRTPLLHRDIVNWLLTRSPFNHMTVAFRTDLVRSVGGYPLVYLKEDYALWCLLAARGARFANVDDVLVHATAGVEMYRRRGGWRYIRSEVEMQYLMVSLGLKGLGRALGHGLARSVVFAMPAAARGLVYRRLLRAKR